MTSLNEQSDSLVININPGELWMGRGPHTESVD